MASSVRLTLQAQKDLTSITEYIAENSSFERAERWYNRMLDALASLSQMPQRCPVAIESEELGHEVRLLLVGKHRHAYKVYFTVSSAGRGEHSVIILHIRHWARQSISEDELEDLAEDEGE